MKFLLIFYYFINKLAIIRILHLVIVVLIMSGCTRNEIQIEMNLKKYSNHEFKSVEDGKIKVICKGYRRSLFSSQYSTATRFVNKCRYIDETLIRGIIAQYLKDYPHLDRSKFRTVLIRIFDDPGNFFFRTLKGVATQVLIPLKSNIIIEIDYIVENSKNEIIESKKFNQSYTELLIRRLKETQYSSDIIIPEIIYQKTEEYILKELHEK